MYSGFNIWEMIWANFSACKNVHILMAESFRCLSEIIITLLIGYIQIQSKKVFLKKFTFYSLSGQAPNLHCKLLDPKPVKYLEAG